jgi:hypothetical protein
VDEVSGKTNVVYPIDKPLVEVKPPFTNKMLHHHLPLYEGDEDPGDIDSYVINFGTMDVTDKMK